MFRRLTIAAVLLFASTAFTAGHALAFFPPGRTDDSIFFCDPESPVSAAQPGHPGNYRSGDGFGDRGLYQAMHIANPGSKGPWKAHIDNPTPIEACPPME